MGTVNLDKEGMGMDLNDLAFLDFCLQVFFQSLKLLRQCLRQLTLAMPSTRETPQGRGRKSLRLGGGGLPYEKVGDAQWEFLF